MGHRYMCILVYVKLISREVGVESLCHGYMCILLYMKLIQCSNVV